MSNQAPVLTAENGKRLTLTHFAAIALGGAACASLFFLDKIAPHPVAGARPAQTQTAPASLTPITRPAQIRAAPTVAQTAPAAPAAPSSAPDAPTAAAALLSADTATHPPIHRPQNPPPPLSD